MKSEKKYTQKDLKEFDSLLNRMEHRTNGAVRIQGRLDFKRFEARFDKETMNEMFEIVKKWK